LPLPEAVRFEQNNLRILERTKRTGKPSSPPLRRVPFINIYLSRVPPYTAFLLYALPIHIYMNVQRTKHEFIFLLSG